MTTTRYEPNWESVGEHEVPSWFDDAKLGVFLHWGLYSIPGWAPQVPNIQEMMRTQGPRSMLRNNPYAEWYLNSMRVPGNPTREHQIETYGPDATYDDFVKPFNEVTRDADLDALAGVCRDAGARYVVLTTKHHDGFTLWPSTQPHPRKGRYHAERDIVGDLTAAVRGAGMRMGLYYSGGYDWPFNDALMTNPADAMLAVPTGQDYLDYATGHVRELIARYSPSVLWNDICWPAGGNLAELFSEYYNTVSDGVINDRWLQPSGPRNDVVDTAMRGAGEVMQLMWRFLPEDWKSLTFPSANHYDFNTPEYASFDEIRPQKWESTRGVGHSFGANRNERPEDIVTATGLVRSFCDIVSKNGNLLIGIGPDHTGAISELQQAPLRGLGEWMAINGEAIYGSRPWEVASTRTSEDTEVRFTRSGEDAEEPTTYVHLVDQPGRRTFTLRDIDASGVTGARLLGTDDALHWNVNEGALEVELPERLPVSAVHVLAVQGTMHAKGRD
ncbi:MAG: alpha-L-fucosidase [Microthrixaceae bacterium]